MAVRKWVALGVLTAMAFLLMFFVNLPLTPVLPFLPPFLKYDPGDVPALVAAVMLGPGAGMAVEFGKNVLYFFSGRSTYGWLGLLPNFLAGASLCLAAGWVYARRPGPWSAALGMGLGVLLMNVVLGVTNYYIFLPQLWGIPREEVAPYIVSMIIPFNLIKGVLTSVLTYGLILRLPLPIKRVMAAGGGNGARA